MPAESAAEAAGGPREIAIVGAGVTGLTLAALLARRPQLRCTLIEAREPDPDASAADMRTLAVSEGVRRILWRAGAWQHLDRDAVGPIRSMHVWDDEGGSIDFDAADVDAPALAWVLRTVELEAALRRALDDAPALSWRRPARVQTLRDRGDRIEAELDDGGIVASELLVGADGANSMVRSLAGVGYSRRDYGQHAVFGIARMSERHGETARQVFLPDGPLALLPMAEPHTIAIVWSTRPDEAAALVDLPAAAFGARVAEATGGCLGELLDLSGRASAALFSAEAEAYRSGRVVLVGDAAHGVHPMAGQGANLGLLDAASLVDCLYPASGTAAPLASRLARYQRWRRSENRLMAQTLDALHLVFHGRGALLSPLRRAGLALTQRFGLARRMLILHASALAGDLPSSARGEI